MKKRTLCMTVVVAVAGLTTSTSATALPGYERVTAVSVTDSFAVKAATATCPAGKQVVGTGAFISGGFGHVVLDQVVPNSQLTSVTARGYEDEDGTPANWSVRAYAVCAVPPAGLEVTTATTATDSLNGKQAWADCSPGKRLIGTGAKITGGFGQVVIDELVPNSATGASAWAKGYEDGTGMTGNWSIQVHAICAAPLPGHYLTHVYSDEGSWGPQSAQAGCQTPNVALGGGWSIDDGFGEVTIEQFLVRSVGVLATAYEDDDGTTQSWQLTTYVSCAP
jgi:hypothetical protein